MPAELLSPGSAAALLGVSIDTLAKWADGGQLAAIRLPSGHRRYRRADIERLLSDAQESRS